MLESKLKLSQDSQMCASNIPNSGYLGLFKKFCTSEYLFFFFTFDTWQLFIKFYSEVN